MTLIEILASELEPQGTRDNPFGDKFPGDWIVTATRMTPGKVHVICRKGLLVKKVSFAPNDVVAVYREWGNPL